MILDLGIIEYKEALKLQHYLVNQRRLGKIPDSALVAEHPHIFTIGRAGSRKNLLVKEEYLNRQGIGVIDVDRAGDITFHSPGQLIIYPILDLKKRVKDLHKYLRGLEEVAINFLQKYAISGKRAPGATGVWVVDKKIAFIGIAAKDWVTYHGLSININNETRFFSMINPCGMKGLKVTSLKEILGQEAPLSSAKRILLGEFHRIFGLEEAQAAYESCPAVA